MELVLVFKIIGVGIITIVSDRLLKAANKDDFATLANIAGITIILFMVVEQVFKLLTTVRTMFNL